MKKAQNWMNWTREADREYCAVCKYRAQGLEIGKYLCLYLAMTCKRRGCAAGCGCTRRVIG